MNITAFIKSWLFLAKQSVRLWMAIKLCNLKQSAFNRRYFVILSSKEKLISLSKSDINRLKRMKRIDKKMTHLDLMENAFYYTPISENNSMTKEKKAEKRKLYMQYIAIINNISLPKSLK